MIFVNKPDINPEASANLSQCITTNWLSSEGPFVKEFESKVADYLGVKYAIATNSGTTALHLAVVGLGIGEGDEVILPASTIGSCFFAIWQAQAKAVAVDVTANTFTIDPDLIEAKITKNTKAIMVVHLYGHPCEMKSIQRIAKKYRLPIIEDTAEAFGSEFKNKKLGGIGKVGCFSFYANKLVTTGEGGMVVTNDRKLAQKVRELRILNSSKKNKFIYDGLGFNYTMSNLQAAVGVAQLKNVSKAIKFKRHMADFYQKNLHKINGLTLPYEEKWAKSTYWMYAVLVDHKKFGMSRDQLAKRLMVEFGIQTRTFFYPPNISFKKMGMYQNEKFPVSQKISREGLYLPSGLGNTFEEFAKTCKAIRKLAKLD